MNKQNGMTIPKKIIAPV